MEKVIFEVETITPMFLAGNEQEKVRVPGRNQIFKDVPPANADYYSWQNVAELRPSSMRGLMRYWQRAIVGSLAATNAERMKLVQEAEQLVFGTTERGSSVQIRIKPLDINILKDISEYDEQNRKKITGKDYLLFSMSDKGQRNANKIIEEKKQAYIQYSGTKLEKRQGEEIVDYQPPRQYIAEKSTFQVTLFVHSDVRDGKDILAKAIAAFWLLANFGGIGSRSRRCAGSIRVKKVENNVTDLLFNEPENAQELEKQLRGGIRYIQQLWKRQFPKTAFPLSQTRVEIATFDILDMIAKPESCSIWILSDSQGVWKSPEDAMESIGGSLKNYRRTSRLNEKTIFGLPIVVQRQHQQPGLKKLYKDLADARMASPLLLRIDELRNNEYVAIAVLFKTRGKHVKNMNDYTRIEQFILKNFVDAKKVEVEP